MKNANSTSERQQELESNHQRYDDDFDLETIFHAEGSSTAEIEALAIKELLESSGVAAIMVGDSLFPNLPFEIKVPRDQAPRARQLIAEAQRVGPAAAEAAELELQRGQAEC